MPSFVEELRGTSFVKEAGGSSVEKAMKLGASLPGPADYTVEQKLKKTGGVIGRSPNKSLIDEAMEKGAKVPGTATSHPCNRQTRM